MRYSFASYIYFSRCDILGGAGVRFCLVSLAFVYDFFFCCLPYIITSRFPLVYVRVCMRVAIKGLREAGWIGLTHFGILELSPDNTRFCFSPWFILFPAFWLEVVVCFCFF